jgi:serine/threonine protein kinase/predicted Zn-dependent protease
MEMSQPSTRPTHTWDEASGPSAVGLARRFEAAWRDSGSSDDRPDPDTFLDGPPGSNPGARLALLRADLGLRWEAGEPVRVEWYRDRYRDLSDDTLVALIYEEFCLREEDQDAPDPSEYFERFPEVRAQLRRVFDIHGLVGSGASTALHLPDPAEVPLPEAGQTIAGFRLVEELGRGTFARVFRAEERQLADRPVAVKVARHGSPEPQTLARLQHTHIVPVHSYRTDPATGLHLLCMPFFGRVTLSGLLEDPAVRAARSGGEVLDALDRLDRPAAKPGRQAPESAARRAFRALPYAKAIALWGAQLAEALQHAHERGILHRDIKPSNVLVTPEGMPMLLDFNLAQAERPDALGPSSQGGTLAYMAPEHLEALADGEPGGVDARADLYALGVVLFEAMGSRPFPARPKSKGGSVVELLHRAARERRGPLPRLREVHPDAPPALEAVVRKCLEADPADRYPDAASLAEDLRAVAFDGPLRHAREPWLSASVRRVRRNRRRLALIAPVLAACMAFVYLLMGSQLSAERLRHRVDQMIQEGREAVNDRRFDVALTHFRNAEQTAHSAGGQPDLERDARWLSREAEIAQQVQQDAARLLGDAEALRFVLLGLDADGRPGVDVLLDDLAPFYVLVKGPNDWTRKSELGFLDDETRRRLVREVDELLFFWAAGLAADPAATPENLETARFLCDRALIFSPSPEPWRAVRERCVARREGRAPRLGPEPEPQQETLAWACFQRALVHRLVEPGRAAPVLAWLDRAVQLDPSYYWAQYYLAYYYERAGQPGQALAHYHAAIALRPDLPYALFSRAQLYWKRGAWERAEEDLKRSLDCQPDFAQARLEYGLVRLRLGDAEGARRDFEAVLAQAGPSSPLGRSARLDMALLDFEAGRHDRARAAYDALLAEAPDGEDAPTVRLGRAQLARRVGRPGAAEADLSALLAERPDDPDELAERALARLALGRTAEAVEDARRARAADPASPGLRRLWLRALLAAGRADELRVERPSDLADLPGGRASLAGEVAGAARALEGRDDPTSLRTRAVLLAALGDPRAAGAADRAVERSPRSARALLIRARVRLALGDRPGAAADVEAGLGLEPDEPSLVELRGLLAARAGDPAAALADFDRALRLGLASPSLHAERAAALLALGRAEDAVEAWTEHLAADPEDPAGYLGRARACLRQGLDRQALADLETAASEAADRPDLLARVALAYASCLPQHPDRLGRVLSLGRRALADALGRSSWNGASPL